MTIAALMVHPDGAFASRCGAARILGLPVPDCPHEHISVRRRPTDGDAPGVENHIAPTKADVIDVGGVRVSAPSQLFIELASCLKLVQLVVAGDALIRLTNITLKDLVAASESSTERGAVAALRAVRYVREDVDSAMESRLPAHGGWADPADGRPAGRASGRTTERRNPRALA